MKSKQIEIDLNADLGEYQSEKQYFIESQILSYIRKRVKNQIKHLFFLKINQHLSGVKILQMEFHLLGQMHLLLGFIEDQQQAQIFQQEVKELTQAKEPQ